MPMIPPAATAPSLEYFRTLVAEDDHFILLEAAAAVGQDEQPDLDAMAVVARIEELGTTLGRRLAADAAAQQRLRMLNHYFFKELGFAGNVNDYYSFRNSHLHAVLETRRGIPITLALIYMEMAHQIGLKVAGISFPGHFLVKCSLAQGEVIIDPMVGRSLSREDLDERLLPYRQALGLVGDFEIPLGLFLQPATPRETLARLLRNLKGIYRERNSPERLLEVLNRMIIVAPDSTSDLRDRGLVYRQLECWRPALQDLADYLAREPGAPDADDIRASVVDLTRRCARLN